MQCANTPGKRRLSAPLFMRPAAFPEAWINVIKLADHMLRLVRIAYTVILLAAAVLLIRKGQLKFDPDAFSAIREQMFNVSFAGSVVSSADLAPNEDVFRGNDADTAGIVGGDRYDIALGRFSLPNIRIPYNAFSARCVRSAFTNKNIRGLILPRFSQRFAVASDSDGICIADE